MSTVAPTEETTVLAEQFPGKGKAKPDETITLFRKQYTGLTITDDESEKAVRKARADVKRVRVAVEKRRKELKADVLERGRLIDGEAKRITKLLTEVEQPLIDEIKRVDDEREAAERAKIEAELEAKRKAERERIEAEQKAALERAEAQQREIEAQQAQLAKDRAEWAAARKAEAEAQAAEKARIEEEQAAQRAELEAARQQIEAQRQENERIERERLEREQAEREAKELAEREAAEAKAKAEREAAEAKQREIEAAAEAKRQEALRPDREKALALAAALAEIDFPSSDDSEAEEIFRRAEERVSASINSLESFGNSK